MPRYGSSECSSSTPWPTRRWPPRWIHHAQLILQTQPDIPAFWGNGPAPTLALATGRRLAGEAAELAREPANGRARLDCGGRRLRFRRGVTVAGDRNALGDRLGAGLP